MPVASGMQHARACTYAMSMYSTMYSMYVRHVVRSVLRLWW